MTTQEIVNKLWNLCDILWDDGITYHQYVTELTYILFLKMAKETQTEKNIPKGYRWDDLMELEGEDLKKFYVKLLAHLGTESEGRIKQIYANSHTNIDEPKNLEKLVKNIDQLDWYSAKTEGLGDLYEGLLEKNATEKKSGAGQYFTPRVLIKTIVELIDPSPGEKCFDPACGTFGFMIQADRYVNDKYDRYSFAPKIAKFQVTEAFTGIELVPDTHRLALMNAMLHGIEGEIRMGDSLSSIGEKYKNYDVIMTNPPFGTKKGGERPTRTDLTYKTSNKQLNFLQVIYRSLNTKTGKARAAVVLPDNVLFQEGDGRKVRTDLMDKCNLHTILRLPTGIFYAQGVKTNVLFFTRGKTEKDNTTEVWFYDMRSGMESLGKRNPLNYEHFTDFIKAYNAKDRTKVINERWKVYTRAEIAIKKDSLDLGLISSNGNGKKVKQKTPIKLIQDAAKELNLIKKEMDAILREIKKYGK
ncbi:MAG: SAM-dependent DNA methyltransferase [Ignavibacteriales bacterium]|nr:SAM-dependent DNA methyltransferase [Ignavibacteriales bacterium]